MIRESFPVGPLQCNCTLLGDESSGEAIVVDPGDEIGEVLTRLARHRLKLKQIIVTHAHIDHVGGAAQLRKATGAPVYLNEQDLSLLGKMEMQAAWLGVPTPETVSPDVLAVEGLAIGLAGIAGEVLHTPGHTQGSICLHFAKENLLLAGDTLFAGSIGRTDLPGGDGRQIMLSLRDRILTLPETTLVVPGHGPETTIAVERETNPFLKGLR
ncbi:MAG TPA: MBL fold metallo-hydrolase [Acidobacteriaceae bacterium]|nr:MBL fold metallo-hydrolase [Acidobacteriaceae bacterium]